MLRFRFGSMRITGSQTGLFRWVDWLLLVVPPVVRRPQRCLCHADSARKYGCLLLPKCFGTGQLFLQTKADKVTGQPGYGELDLLLPAARNGLAGLRVDAP